MFLSELNLADIESARGVRLPAGLCIAPVTRQSGKVMLPQHFVGCDCNGVREIEAAERLTHGNADAALRMRRQNAVIEAGVLPAEDEKGLIGIGNLGVERSGLGGKVKIRILRGGRGILRKKRIEIFVVIDVELVPVIEYGAL